MPVLRAGFKHAKEKITEKTCKVTDMGLDFIQNNENITHYQVDELIKRHFV